MEGVIFLVLLAAAAAIQSHPWLPSWLVSHNAEENKYAILHGACVLPNRTVLARKSMQEDPRSIQSTYDMGIHSFSSMFQMFGQLWSQKERTDLTTLQVKLLEDGAFDEAIGGLSHEGRDAVIRGVYGVGLGFWHSTLEGPWGLEMWSHLKKHAASPGSCPDVDLILSNSCLGRRSEVNKNVCFDKTVPEDNIARYGIKNAAWDTGYDFLYAQSMVSDLKKRVMTFWDMDAGRCYDRIFVGAPKLTYPFNDITSQIMDGYGDCITQRQTGTKRKDADANNPMILFVNRNRTCRRHVTNEKELLSAIAQRGFTNLKSVDFDTLTREEQFDTASKADIMIQPHGAGLGWMSVMATNGVVMELNDDNPNDYETWASWTNKIHYLKIMAETDGTIADCKIKQLRLKHPNATVTPMSLMLGRRTQISMDFVRSGNENPMRVPEPRFLRAFETALVKLRS